MRQLRLGPLAASALLLGGGQLLGRARELEHLVRQHQQAEHLVHHRRSGLRREGPLVRQLRVPLAEEELLAKPPRILRRRLVLVAAMPSGAGLSDSHRRLHRPFFLISELRRVVHLEELTRLEPIQGGRLGVVRRHSDRSPPRLPSARPRQRVLVLLHRREGSGRRRMLLVLLRRQVGSGHPQRTVSVQRQGGASERQLGANLEEEVFRRHQLSDHQRREAVLAVWVQRQGSCFRNDRILSRM